ncbi:MAG TPA: prolyl oligopeptidase family serine peptidase [Vicinamibacterales bacterium]|nr:prolyl oligopeptidase family serine peptidase [Vicinamibacterales bacterium]
MRSTLLAATAIIATITTLDAQSASRSATTGYQLPPKVIVDILDAPPTPTVVVGPNRKLIALLERRSMPTIAELAEPIYRVAGERINPKTNGRQQRTGGITAITLKSIESGDEKKVTTPADAQIGSVTFSPDGRHLAFTNTKPDGIELWIADTATGQAKLFSGPDRINATAGDPCDWLQNSTAIVCTIVSPSRGPAPVEPRVPSGPNVLETSGKAAPAPTFEDLIKTRFDEDVFEYYFTSQLASYDLRTGRRTDIGRPGILAAVSISPDDEYVLVTRLKRPFSHLLGMNGFPRDVEIWDLRGVVVHTVANLPSGEGVPIEGVQTGPRQYRWRADQPATVTWVEALDEGNPKNKVPFRDRVVSLASPFTGQPSDVAKTEWRFSGLSYSDKGVGFLSESDRTSRRTRTWIVENGAASRKLFDLKQEDAYANPGTFVIRHPGGPIMQTGRTVYLIGPGASPDGERPFIDRLDLDTLKTERRFRASEKTYESIVAPLDDEAKTLLTRYETPNDPPNYFVRDVVSGNRRAVTTFPDPAPQLRGVRKEFVSYTRKDGVGLNGTLYLPPAYKEGQRLPMVMWAYPREFGDADSAGQVTGSPYRFTTYTGPTHLFLLTQGYAIFDNPSMPIIGEGETANDHYVEQLTMDAEAAVDKVVSMGVADRDRIGIGGHSYGAFMTANLLAHTDLFRAGVARSGAYNRTLTPFGFQNERRIFWEVPEVYEKMSPFFYADKVNEPILLIHGEADDNSGTFPIQSERFYMALKGFGATVRYVTLPYEAHGYAGRESVLDTLAEMVNWFDKFVKNAPPRSTTTEQRDK